MARKKKEQKEKYIKTRVSKITGLSSYQVFIEPNAKSADERYTATFAEKDYGSKEEALKAAIRDKERVLALIDLNGTITISKKSTVDDIFKEMIELSSLSVGSIYTYTKKYNSIFKKTIGSSPIAQVNVAQIHRIVKMYGNSSQAYIHGIENIARIIFRYAYKNNYILLDPMLLYNNIQSTKIISPKNQSLVLEDYLEIRKYYSKYWKSERLTFDNQCKLVALDCLYYTGIRPSEAFALNKSDFNFENHTVNIYKALDYYNSPNILIKTTKSKSGIRIMPLSPKLEIALIDWFKIQPSERVFAKYDGKYLNPRRLGSDLVYITNKLDIIFNLYQLRHNFATGLVTNNVDPRTFQELMGHSNSVMSISYARSNDELKSQAIKNIADLN